MTGIFKANNPFNPLLLFICGILLKFSMFLYPAIPQSGRADGFLYKILLDQIAITKITVLYPILAFILLFIQAINFNKLCSDQKLFQKPNYLIALSYLLITSLFTEWQILSSSLIINTFMIWVWAKMSSLYNNPNPKTTLFNIAIVIGCSTFFYLPSLAFILLAIFGLSFIRPFNFAEWLIALLGFITPYYFFLSFVFLTDSWQIYSFPDLTISYPKFKQINLVYINFIVIAIITLIGFYFVQIFFKKQLIQTRKSWGLIFLYFIIAVLIPFFNSEGKFTYWILCAVPISVFVAAAFFYTKKWISLLLHWLIVLLIIIINYY